MKCVLVGLLAVALAVDDPRVDDRDHDRPASSKTEGGRNSVLLDLRLQALEREAAWLESLDRRLRSGQSIAGDLLDSHVPERRIEAATARPTAAQADGKVVRDGRVAKEGTEASEDAEGSHVLASIREEELKLRELMAELEMRRHLESRPRAKSTPEGKDPSKSPATEIETPPAPMPPPEPAWIDPVLAGDLQFRLGKLDGALAAYEQVPADSPFADWAGLRAARCLEKLGKLAEAEARYAEVQSKHATGPFHLHIELGLAVVRLKREIEAKQ